MITLECGSGFHKGIAGLERLILNLSENEKCVSKLIHLEPGIPINVLTNVRKGLKLSIKLDPIKGVTDTNGEIQFTISVIIKKHRTPEYKVQGGLYWPQYKYNAP